MWMRIPERVVAEGSRKVMTGKDRTSWRYTARLLPRARSRIVLASRSARPLRTTATPIVSTPIRKKGTGLAKPCSASRRLVVAPLSASRVTLRSAATPGARISARPQQNRDQGDDQRPLTGQREAGEQRGQEERRPQTRERDQDS